MKPDLALVIANLVTLRKDDGSLVVPAYAQVNIETFEYPYLIGSTKAPSAAYYQLYLIFPLTVGTEIKRPNNCFSIPRRVESVDRTDEAWIMTITSMLQEEKSQRAYVTRRSQQARRQQWLLGDASTRIDGKDSTHVPPRQRGFMF